MPSRYSGGADHNVAPIGGSGSKKLRHPRLGAVEYGHVVLQVAGHPDQALVTCSPVSGR